MNGNGSRKKAAEIQPMPFRRRELSIDLSSFCEASLTVACSPLLTPFESWI